MAWIPMIDEDDAEGPLRRLYDQLESPHGGVDNILRIHSLNPPTLRGHLALYRSVMHGPSPLTRAEREMVAVVVSAENHCRY